MIQSSHKIRAGRAREVQVKEIHLREPENWPARSEESDAKAS